MGRKKIPENEAPFISRQVCAFRCDPFIWHKFKATTKKKRGNLSETLETLILNHVNGKDNCKEQ